MSPQLLPDNPNREALLKALLALSSHTHGRPLTPDDLRIASEEILAGMLLAAAEHLVDQGRKQGRGNSRGHQAVRGYMNYLDATDLEDFFLARVHRLYADMTSYKSVRTDPHL
ncbi:hypothetical protein AB0395_44610 [Streptosporangium sp. NPDC051023]|uniref:hypothetical protein n=1 Tax=Streptosporangium sp. NPDC051023 TaxID=3155410 RepID=UPI00344C82BB